MWIVLFISESEYCWRSTPDNNAWCACKFQPWAQFNQYTQVLLSKSIALWCADNLNGIDIIILLQGGHASYQNWCRTHGFGNNDWWKLKPKLYGYETSCLNSLLPSDNLWRYKSRSTLAERMARCSTKPLLPPMCLVHSSESNCTWISHELNSHVFGDYIFEVTATFTRGEWVKAIRLCKHHCSLS